MAWLITPSQSLRKARFVENVPDDSTWHQLHLLVDAALPALFRDVMRILGEVGRTLPRDEAAALLHAGDRAGLRQLLHHTWQVVGESGLQDALAPRLRALAMQAADATTLVAVEAGFNRADPEAIAAIDAAAGARIVAISQTTREAVQGIVRRAFESGTPIMQQISEIAEVVGLTPRQAEAVARYRQGLIAAGEIPGRVQELVERQARAGKRLRAEAIVRTESMNAVHEGQQARWDQAVRDGFLDPSRLRRLWIVAPDERLCPVCASIPGLNPDGVGLNQPFFTPIGPIMMPTAHPMCRCTVSGRVTP